MLHLNTPYLLAPAPDSMTVAWLIDGKKKGSVVYAGADGREQRVRGVEAAGGQRPKKVAGRGMRAVLKELAPCARYRYRLSPWEKGLPHSFRTPPEPGKSCEGGFRFVALGDTRHGHEHHANVVAAMRRFEPALVLNSGDMVTTTLNTDEWFKFVEVERELLADVPLLLVAGNHEAQGGKAFGKAMLKKLFGTKEYSGSGHRYVDWGVARFIMVDAYLGEHLDKKGTEWLEQTLAKTPEDRLVFLIMHLPIYSFGRHGVYDRARKLRPLMKKYRVKAVFAGHAHGYEHFHVEGTHHLTLGGGGAPFHEPDMNVIEEERHLKVSSGKFHHFLSVEIVADEIRFTVFNTDTGEVHEKWSVPIR